MSYPALYCASSLSITQMIVLSVCLQLIAIFAKIFQESSWIHRCLIESTLVGCSFPLLVGAIHNLVTAWFATNEKTLAYAIAYSTVPITAFAKFTFMKEDIMKELKEETFHNITIYEIVEANLFSLFGLAAIFFVLDKPAQPPSFIATLGN